tara:strand:- start:2560 stop:2805 length:246 start_codon:yes stop_codon:yes gene_type:complete
MNILNFIVTQCFGGAPAMPPMPPAPAPLPDVSQQEEEKQAKARAAAAKDKKRGRASLITNQGGASGLEEDGNTAKQKLGGY